MVEFPNDSIKVKDTTWKFAHVTLLDVDHEDYTAERYQGHLEYDEESEVHSLRITMPMLTNKMIENYDKAYTAQAKNLDKKAEADAKSKDTTLEPVLRKYLPQVEVAHQATITKVLNNPKLRTMDIVLQFPEGMALTSEPFKPSVGDYPHKVVRTLILGAKKTKNAVFLSPFVTFKFGILGSENHLKPNNEDNAAAAELEAQLGLFGVDDTMSE